MQELFRGVVFNFQVFEDVPSFSYCTVSVLVITVLTSPAASLDFSVSLEFCHVLLYVF